MEFEANKQGVIFLILFSLGFVFGCVSCFCECEHLKHRKTIYFAINFFRYVFLALFFISMRNFYDLPALKWWFLLAFYLGFYIYQKTCAKVIAKFVEKLYNNFVKRVKNFKKRRWIKSEFGKIKPNRISGNRNVRTFVIHSRFGYGVSNGNHKRQKSKNSRTKRTNRSA